MDPGLFPFESHFAEIDGNPVHYVDEGHGPVLLMLHGNPTWSFVYRDVIAALRDRFRCVALDYPGFGLSQPRPGYRFLPSDHAAIVVGLLQHLDLTGVTLVVQDWGGPIGMRAALDERDRIAGLVIGNTWAWPVNGDRHFEMFSRLMGGPVGRLLIRRANLFVNVMVPAGHRRRRLSGQEMRHYRRPLPTPAQREPTAILPAQITAARSFLTEIEGALGTLRDLPALILWGDADFAFRARERERWESILPRHTTVVIRGAGHYVQSDAPDEFAGAISSWDPAVR